MHITVGGILALLVPVGAWVIATAISNDPGCLSIENSLTMSEPVRAFMKIFLLCEVV